MQIKHLREVIKDLHDDAHVRAAIRLDMDKVRSNGEVVMDELHASHAFGVDGKTVSLILTNGVAVQPLGDAWSYPPTPQSVAVDVPTTPEALAAFNAGAVLKLSPIEI